MALNKSIPIEAYLESSFITNSTYLAKTGKMTLLINKTVYNFFHVPIDIYFGLLESGSTGYYFNTHIRDKYNYEKE